MTFFYRSCLAILAGVVSVSAWAEDSSPEPVEELVVVASRLPTQTYKIGHAVTVLDELQIKNLGFEYAADLFRFIPGVAVSRTGGYGGTTQLRIRGAESNHVVVLIDGIDVSAAGTGEFDFSSLLASDIERIEVLRGPMSGLYGSNALAGVISIHSKRPQQGFAFNTDIEVGENATRHGSISVTGGTERVNGRLSYTVRNSEFDLSEDDSVMGSEDDEDKNQTLLAQVHLQVTDVLAVDLFGRRTEKDTDTDGFDFSGGPAQGLAIDDNSFSETEDQTLGLVVTLQLADGHSLSRLAVNRTDSETDGGTFGSESRRDQFNFDTSWMWQTSGTTSHRTTFFLQREEETFKNLFPFDPSQVPTQDRDLTGYGLEHRIEINDSLFLAATLRQDDNDKFEDTTTYSIDASYRFNQDNTRLHASYGSAVTNPTFFEQFGFVPGTFVGNPDLEPEESKGWDLGIEQIFLDQTLIVDLTYFDADLKDEIQSIFPSVVNIDGDSDRRGVEVSVTYQPTDNTSIVANFTYTDADEPGGEEVRRPENTASLSVAHQFMDKRASISGNVIFNGEMLDTDFRNFFSNGFVAERTQLDSYTLFNLKASYALTDALEIYLRVENIFDENYVEVISFATPGRTAYVGMQFRFAN